MLLGAHPYVAVAPFAQLTQFLHFGVIVQDVVFLRKPGWVIYPDVAAETEEDACCFVGEEAGVRPGICEQGSVSKGRSS